MKFYLIYPRIPFSFVGYEYSTPLIFRKAASPPLGLLTIAAQIPRRHEVEFCDENAEEINWNSDCDIVLLTGMHLQKGRIHQIATRFRELGKRVIIGGPSVMAIPETYRDVADILVVGEAEYIWPACLKDLEAGTAKDLYKETEIVSMDDSPIPRYELLNPKHYMSLTIQTTRGCPFRCEFCDIITLYGRKVRSKPIPQVIQELEALYEIGAERLYIVDDNIIGNQKYAVELCEALISLKRGRKRPFVFSCQATVNVTRKPELLRLLHEAGCRSMFVGIETPRASSLAETQKTQNTRTDLLKDVEMIQSYGIQLYSGLMVGFDHDDRSIFKEQIDFTNDAKIPIPFPVKVGALPGTPLHKRMIKEGRLLSQKDFQITWESNIQPKLMSMRELNEGYVEMIQDLFDPKAYANRVLGELERLDRAGRRLSNYNLFLIYPAFLWVLAWFLLDKNRRRLLRAFFRVAPTALRKYPSCADGAVQKLILYRHICRYVDAATEGLQESTTPASGPQRAAEAVS